MDEPKNLKMAKVEQAKKNRGENQSQIEIINEAITYLEEHQPNKWAGKTYCDNSTSKCFDADFNRRQTNDRVFFVKVTNTMEYEKDHLGPDGPIKPAFASGFCLECMISGLREGLVAVTIVDDLDSCHLCDEQGEEDADINPFRGVECYICGEVDIRNKKGKFPGINYPFYAHVGKFHFMLFFCMTCFTEHWYMYCDPIEEERRLKKELKQFHISFTGIKSFEFQKKE